MELNTLELGTQNWSWSVTTTIGGTRIDFSAVFAFARIRIGRVQTIKILQINSAHQAKDSSGEK